MPEALDGILVIDFGQYIAGPLAGMLLADQGADVIRIDPPGGPHWQTPGNATWNRGKRSIVLDIKQAEDLKTAQGLILKADVVVENFRPGVMNRLGLGAEQMAQANSPLVYCSIPGFASDDPRAGVRAYEGIVGAATATYRPSQPHADRPVYTAIPIASVFGAFQAAVSIAMALNARERDSLGQIIEVPLFNAMFPSIGRHGLRVHHPTREAPTLGTIWGGFFQCKDGQWVRFGGSGNKNFRQFVEASGISSWDAEGITDLDGTLPKDAKAVAEIEQRMNELFKSRTAQEWEDLISQAGSEGVICRTSEDWLGHPHARESQMVIEVNDPRYGKMLQPGINVRMSLTPGKVRGPAPELDQHRDEVLAELTAPRQAGSRSPAEATVRTALEGVRVLDLCIILAGPTLGRTLAEFGADVIKIDDPNRGGTIFRHNDVNRGKRSILLDLKSEEGREIFWRMLEDAEVVAQNYRAGKLEQLGLGYEEVRNRKPDIVYASLNAYGHIGPWAGRPGHEGFAQSATGMHLRFGGDGPPVGQPNSVNDYGTSFMGAYAVALALFHRLRTGRGQHVDTALAYTAMTLQSPFMQLYEGKKWDEIKGQDALGIGPLNRMYRAKDGWVFIAALDSDLPHLARIDGLSGVESLRDRRLESWLQERFIEDNVENWVARLTNAGIGAHRVITDVAELMDDSWVSASGLGITREHDELGLVTTCGPAPRLSRTQVHPGRPAPRPGSDAMGILEELGLGARYKRLVESQVIVTDGVKAG